MTTAQARYAAAGLDLTMNDHVLNTP